MQGIYTCIPETSYVPREYSVAAILLLLFMVLISLVSVLNLLNLYISTRWFKYDREWCRQIYTQTVTVIFEPPYTFRSMCAVPNMAVFCSSLTSWFPGMLPMYFVNDFTVVPVAPVVTGITFVFTFHMHSISIVMYLYFGIFSAFFQSQFCLLWLQRLLAYIFPFHYHGL